MYDSGSLLEVVGRAVGTLLKGLAVPHKNTGQEVFSGRPIGAEEVVCYYYGSLVYFDRGRQK